jgi:hypothetical protein
MDCGYPLKYCNAAIGTLYAEDRGSGPGLEKRSQRMGDTAYIIGVIIFFILCALYVAVLDRM